MHGCFRVHPLLESIYISIISDICAETANIKTTISYSYHRLLSYNQMYLPEKKRRTR